MLPEPNTNTTDVCISVYKAFIPNRHGVTIVLLITDWNIIVAAPIANAVINDIVNDKIQVLIVDYKIIVSTALVEGTEIFRRISETVPKFPIIILNNVPEDCYKKEFVDADKVYSKGRFFKLEENYSKEKTLNIFRNMDNYTAQRAKLSTKLANHLSLVWYS